MNRKSFEVTENQLSAVSSNTSFGMIAFSSQHSTLGIKIPVVERSTRTKHYSRGSADACRQCARAIQSGVSKSTRMPGWKKIFYIRFIKSLSRVTFSHRNGTDDSMEEIRPSLDHFQEPFAGNVQPILLHKQLKVPDCSSGDISGHPAGLATRLQRTNRIVLRYVAILVPAPFHYCSV